MKQRKKSKKTKDIVINIFISKDKKERKRLVNEKILNVIIALESTDDIIVGRI